MGQPPLLDPKTRVVSVERVAEGASVREYRPGGSGAPFNGRSRLRGIPKILLAPSPPDWPHARDEPGSRPEVNFRDMEVRGYERGYER